MQTLDVFMLILGITVQGGKNNAFVAKIVNTRVTNIFMAICALCERLPTSATLPSKKIILGVTVEGY